MQNEVTVLTDLACSGLSSSSSVDNRSIVRMRLARHRGYHCVTVQDTTIPEQTLGRRWGDYATSRTPTVAAADCIGVVVVVVVEEEDEEGNWSPVAGGTRAAVSPGGLAMCAMCASVAAEGRPVDSQSVS